MNHLEELRKIKEEARNMPFSYENVHRIMHLVYISKELFQPTVPVPNKEIALHQVTKIIENDFTDIIKCGQKNDLQEAYNQLLSNFQTTLNYI